MSVKKLFHFVRTYCSSIVLGPYSRGFLHLSQRNYCAFTFLHGKGVFGAYRQKWQLLNLLIACIVWNSTSQISCVWAKECIFWECMCSSSLVRCCCSNTNSDMSVILNEVGENSIRFFLFRRNKTASNSGYFLLCKTINVSLYDKSSNTRRRATW